MANKDRKYETMVDEIEEQPVKQEEVKAAPVSPPKDLPAAALAAVITGPELVISFDRWFSTTGKLGHWKTGMKAYANTSGKKNLAAWAKLFENY